MDRGAWHAAVHGIAKSRSQLSDRAQTREEVWAVFLLVVLFYFQCFWRNKEVRWEGKKVFLAFLLPAAL